MSDEIVIHRALAADIEAILRLERECGQAPQWGQTVWQELLAANGVGLRCVMVAEGAADVVGFVATGGVAGIAELESVAVGIAFRGQGVGKALCRRAMQYVASQGAIAIELEVRESSVAARRMYARLGFTEQGSRRGYYQEPMEDAVLMAAVLAGI